uniref:Helix-turn-helix domain-containing protein n=2 Tax=Candidatus Kentrum sp. TC TaxID=2126339 RepID=A0A450Z6A6_9GAMM|nr:MAG: hypothetical protein BECKTC1821E_GA0114239_11742 [Candidatus Kentron sp. TC]
MRLTTFGKRVRQLRIEADLLMMDQAKALGVSSAYVSATETGSKPPSVDYVQRVISFFARHKIDASELASLADRARDEIRWSMENYHPEDRSLVTAFARRFPDMTGEQKAKIRTFLGD